MTDKKCPFVIYLNENKTIDGPGYYCTSTYRNGEVLTHDDYFLCTSDNHETCFWHSQESRLKGMIEK